MWGHMDWGGWGMGWGWFGLMHLLWWVVVIGAAAVFLRWAIGGSRHRDTGEDSARRIVRERYARGEIDKPEFDERMKHLGG
jgi:putative membrane protein